AEPCVIHEHLEVRHLCYPRQGLALPGAIREIDRQDLAPAPVLRLKLLRERPKPLLAPGDEEQIVAVARQASRECGAEPGRRTGDDSCTHDRWSPGCLEVVQKNAGSAQRGDDPARPMCP